MNPARCGAEGPIGTAAGRASLVRRRRTERPQGARLARAKPTPPQGENIIAVIDQINRVAPATH